MIRYWERETDKGAYHRLGILILSAGYGEGHRQAAVAIEQALKDRLDPVRVEVVDYMEMVHPVVNTITRYMYEKSVKNAPNSYGLFYRQTDRLLPKSPLQPLVRKFGAQKLFTYIQSTKPRLVINTFPLSAGALSWLKERELTTVMSATVITDYTVHSQWVHDHTDCYFVGAEHVKDMLLQKGVSPQCIRVTGIPVRRCFHLLYDRQHLKRAFGLDSRPTALVMGGWHGVFNASLCERLVKAGEGAQLLIVCGGDRQLFHRMIPLQMKYPDRVRVFGYVSNVPELMTVSDFVMTKAGGLTTSEALTIGLPMLLYRPIPGQEEANARFFIREGAAHLARNEAQLINKFQRMCRDRDGLAQMKRRAESIKTQDAAADIAELALQWIHYESREMHVIRKMV